MKNIKNNINTNKKIKQYFCTSILTYTECVYKSNYFISKINKINMK